METMVAFDWVQTHDC